MITANQFRTPAVSSCRAASAGIAPWTARATRSLGCPCKGYPVRGHRMALKRLGASPIHRRSFTSVRAILGLPPLPPWRKPEGAMRGEAVRKQP